MSLRLSHHGWHPTVFFIVYKGAKGLDLDETSLSTAFAYAFGVGGACAIAMFFTVLPYMRKKIAAKFNEDGTLKQVRRDSVPGSGNRWLRCDTPVPYAISMPQCSFTCYRALLARL